MTQDVFLKAHRGIDRLDASRDPGPWLHAIAVNACRDVWRSSAWRLSRRSAPADEGSIASGLGDPKSTPEEAAIQAERERIVQEAIAELPEPLRLAVVLHDFGGLDQLQVAELTGVNHAAARKRYSRALRRLGQRLRGAWAP